MNALLDPLVLLVVLPLLSAAVLPAVSAWRSAAILNVAVTFAVLACSVLLLRGEARSGEYLYVDELNSFFILVTAFGAFTTSLYSYRYIGFEIEGGRLAPGRARFYHAMFQSLLFGMLLALTANNIGVVWVAVELATLSTISMVGLYGTPQSLEAAWKYFILGSVGIALALFGVILVYMAAEPVVGDGYQAMVWSELTAKAAGFSPRLLNIAFVFLVLGFGTKLGLVPMHGWLPDAHAEGPTPVTAVLSGLMLNVALYALVRFKMILSANGAVIGAGPFFIGLGLLSLLFGALMLYRRDDIKRLFGYSSIEHMGLVAIAFGIGGPLANFGGLLHIAMHALTKSAVFFTVGQISQAVGAQKIAHIRGLTESNPKLGWMLVAGVLAIAGMPPFGVFLSEYLILNAALAFQPWLALTMGVALLAAFAALMWRLTGLTFGEPHGHMKPVRISVAPVALHLLLVLLAGVFLPNVFSQWLERIARMIG